MPIGNGSQWTFYHFLRYVFARQAEQREAETERASTCWLTSQMPQLPILDQFKVGVRNSILVSYMRSRDSST